MFLARKDILIMAKTNPFAKKPVKAPVDQSAKTPMKKPTMPDQSPVAPGATAPNVPGGGVSPAPVIQPPPPGSKKPVAKKK